MKNETQQIFQVCSYFLSYPNHEWMDCLEEIEEEIESLSNSCMKVELIEFCHSAKSFPPEELRGIYVNTFDFGKKTNLYITYMSNGEQRERGMDLLYLKNYYKLHGFLVTDKELPDYLPIMLEFASQVNAEEIKPIFEPYLENIIEIQKHLVDESNLYRHVFQAMIKALEKAGVNKAVRRSEAICSDNFCG